jgi:hypothetical protein
MKAYFDTNVYGHIYRHQHGVTNAVEEKLRSAKEAGTVEIYTSYSVVEETNTGRLVNLDDVNGCLETIRTLAILDPIIRHHPDILEDDIVAFANNNPLPSKFEKALPGLQNIFWDHTAKNYEELDKVAVETKEMIVAFSDKMTASFNNKIRPQAQVLKDKGEQQPFEDYWNDMAPSWAEQVAERLGVLEKVKARGIDGLLNVHSFCVLTTAQLSLSYANTYERTKFGKENSRDMHHVACASAVPIFVTHDKQLRTVLARKPIKELEVLDLHELLARL